MGGDEDIFYREKTVNNMPGYADPPKEYQFKPGQSGNPKGKPKDTLKAFMARKFRAMSDEEKEAWLTANKVDPNLIWQMAEGRPDTKTEHSGEMTINTMTNEQAIAILKRRNRGDKDGVEE